MRWADARREPPERDGQFFTWDRRYGKCVTGFVGGKWGADGSGPEWWLENDQMPRQATDGSFDRGGYEVLTK